MAWVIRQSIKDNEEIIDTIEAIFFLDTFRCIVSLFFDIELEDLLISKEIFKRNFDNFLRFCGETEKDIKKNIIGSKYQKFILNASIYVFQVLEEPINYRRHYIAYFIRQFISEISSQYDNINMIDSLISHQLNEKENDQSTANLILSYTEYFSKINSNDILSATILLEEVTIYEKKQIERIFRTYNYSDSSGLPTLRDIITNKKMESQKNTILGLYSEKNESHWEQLCKGKYRCLEKLSEGKYTPIAGLKEVRTNFSLCCEYVKVNFSEIQKTIVKSNGEPYSSGHIKRFFPIRKREER